MNSLIMDTKRVKLPDWLRCTNYIDDDEPYFGWKKRKERPSHVVLHETAGNSASRCKAGFSKNPRRKSAHLIVDRDGSISCHADLILDVCSHAKQCNPTGIGIEFVNPYAPSLVKLDMVVQTIAAKWWTWCPNKKDRRYVLPTKEQMKVLTELVPIICHNAEIPYVFPTWYLNKKIQRIKGWRKPPLGWNARPEAGVVAHMDFSTHADGRYLLEALILMAGFNGYEEG